MSEVQVQGKKFKPSNRPSSDVKVGDWVKVKEHIAGSSNWPLKDQNTRGTYQQVEGVFDNGVNFVDNSGYWRMDYFTIMEEIPEQTKTPRNHPHAEMIRQWLDDASLEVEWRAASSEMWTETKTPQWQEYNQYRIKPKTVPAWQVLYEHEGSFDMSAGHYKTEDEFNKSTGVNEKFIKFILETEKQELI